MTAHGIGIDGSVDPRGTDPRNQSLSDRRVDAVRDALVQAGVPADKITDGPFGDAQLRRVEVLISTRNLRGAVTCTPRCG